MVRFTAAAIALACTASAARDAPRPQAARQPPPTGPALGFFWLAILLWLAATDFITRPQFPPKPPGPEVSLSLLIAR